MVADEGVDSQGAEAKDRTPVTASLAANAMSSIGNHLTFLAVPWSTLETTGSAARTRLVGAAVAIGAVTSYTRFLRGSGLVLST